jgi:cytochrome c553
MRWLLRSAALFFVLGLGAFLLSASGIVSIKASSGHWPITRWFLQFSKQRSVATHTLGMKVPVLDEPGMVLKGATHYEIGCRSCHGSPEFRQPRIAHRMEPAPPYLPQTIATWQPEELFYIVKHGIKFTGMPSWPSQQRDDEVWAMVAFLMAFPKMDADQYRQLVNGNSPGSIDAVSLATFETESADANAINNCASCHGVDGLGREVGAFPKLAGQSQAYLAATLEAFARGERHSGIMEPIAARLNSRQMHNLARHYESLTSSDSVIQKMPQAIERGKGISQLGVPSQDVPACAACHGPNNTLHNPIYPVLAGQSSEYLFLQLTLFKQDKRGGTTYAHLMRHTAFRMNDEQMQDVADYYASLTPNAVAP